MTSRIPCTTETAGLRDQAFASRRQANENDVANPAHNAESEDGPPAAYRAKASLLLKEGGVDAVFGAVGDFPRSKAEHQRRAVPYRLDIPLRGMPGSGKPSVITAAASWPSFRSRPSPPTTPWPRDSRAPRSRMAAPSRSRMRTACSSTLQAP